MYEILFRTTETSAGSTGWAMIPDTKSFAEATQDFSAWIAQQQQFYGELLLDSVKLQDTHDDAKTKMGRKYPGWRLTEPILWHLQIDARLPNGQPAPW